MKHFYTLLLFAFVTSAGYSQITKIRAGVNLSKLSIYNDDGIYSDVLSNKFGLQVGILADYPINEIFSIETGGVLSSKGYKIVAEPTTSGLDTYEFQESMNVLYIDIPISLKVALTTQATKLYAAIGPYLGFGIIGNRKATLTVNGQSETQKQELYWDARDIKRLDLGLNLGGGLEFNNMQIGVYYGIGFINISGFIENGSTIKNRVLSFTLAYNLKSN